MKIEIRPQWLLRKQDESTIALPLLLSLLSEIRNLGSISGAAKAAGLSYRHAWGLLREFESQFGASLVDKVRGQGTVLSALGEKLIWADKRVAARLSPLLDSLASELERELEALLSGRKNALRITASHGFAVDALIRQLAERDIPVDLKYRSSTEAVATLWRGECDLAGFHVPVGEFHEAAASMYRRWLDPKRHALIHLAYRTQGLFVAKGNPKGIQGVTDLRRKDVRFVNRQSGSGTRVLLELFLAKNKIKTTSILGYESTEFTHAAVAAYVASGMADVSFGVEAAARRFDLDFIPILRERYFFACEQESLEQGVLDPIRDIIKSEAFKGTVAGLAGYDGTGAGSVESIQSGLLGERTG